MPSTPVMSDDLAAQWRARVVDVAGVERRVAVAHAVVHDGERLRHAEVVVHRRGEVVGDRTAEPARRRRRAGDRPLEEAADAVERGLRLVERATA